VLLLWLMLVVIVLMVLLLLAAGVGVLLLRSWRSFVCSGCTAWHAAGLDKLHGWVLRVAAAHALEACG
jgi:hypothetical protein